MQSVGDATGRSNLGQERAWKRRRFFRYLAGFFSSKPYRPGPQSSKTFGRSCDSDSDRDRVRDRLAFRRSACRTVSRGARYFAALPALRSGHSLARDGPGRSDRALLYPSDYRRIGGEAIVKRIQERMEDYEHVQQAGLTTSTSFQSVEAIKRSAGESMKDFVEKVATQIQELMDEEILSRMVKNE